MNKFELGTPSVSAPIIRKAIEQMRDGDDYKFILVGQDMAFGHSSSYHRDITSAVKLQLISGIYAHDAGHMTRLQGKVVFFGASMGIDSIDTEGNAIGFPRNFNFHDQEAYSKLRGEIEEKKLQARRTTAVMFLGVVQMLADKAPEVWFTTGPDADAPALIRAVLT